MNSNENLGFNVRLSTRAYNYFKRTDKITQKRIAAAIEIICVNLTNGSNIKPLQGFVQKYRYRIGKMRVIYSVKTEERLIVVEVIGSRGDVYKK